MQTYFTKKAMIIHDIPLSLTQYVETELNKKKVIYLSKGNVFYGISFVNRCPLPVQIHPNYGNIYCAFLIEYVWNSA